jgi:hypothetical protein
MADPILGKDVIIQFYKGGSYFNYGCAAEVEAQFSMDTKSVKTVGDGVWKRSKGQSLGLQIELSGVIQDDNVNPTVFDLLDYLTNMTDIQYRLLFYDNIGLKKVIEGFALPINVNMGGGSDGHATGSITLSGQGDPSNIYTPPNPPSNPPGNPPPPPCQAEIETAHTEIIGPPNRRYVFIDTMVAGGATISRWDYTINGGGVQTKFTNGSIPTSWILPLATNTGTHTIVITPICDNGFSGTPFTLDIP